MKTVINKLFNAIKVPFIFIKAYLIKLDKSLDDYITALESDAKKAKEELFLDLDNGEEKARSSLKPRRFRRIGGFKDDTDYIVANGYSAVMFREDGSAKDVTKLFPLETCIMYVESGDWEEISVDKLDKENKSKANQFLEVESGISECLRAEIIIRKKYIEQIKSWSYDQLIHKNNSMNGALLNTALAVMKVRLGDKNKEGYGGWWECPKHNLITRARMKLNKYKHFANSKSEKIKMLVDVLNYSAMALALEIEEFEVEEKEQKDD